MDSGKETEDKAQEANACSSICSTPSKISKLVIEVF